MTKEVKRIRKIKESVDTNKVYAIEEAVKILMANSKLKFPETLDVAVKLGVNPQHSDQIVRGVVQLPNGTGKTVKIAVLARGDKAAEAQAAGADIVGAEDLIEIVEKGEINFDKLIATPDMMALLGRVAKILGPKGLMPNAKLGSVTVNVKGAVEAAKAGQVEFRAEKAGIVHAGLGKLNFKEDALIENVKVFFDALAKAKPSGAKGAYFVRASISSTMGVGLKLDLSSVVKL
ncbi:MAG: 50S ribosomal protein L1 [Alphaproteobacteria bacterium]|jgi:large subunit ribosomal protein L1|nr:50S ribosomal protein L1 [Alphaproteobacteria bacterium]